MTNREFEVKNIEELEDLFEDAPLLPEKSYEESFYGTFEDLKGMPVYVSNFEPYSVLAKECGMTSFSLKQSTQTKRIYAWNVNHGGHYPVLELRPVRIEHVKNIELMRQYHENHAYDLGMKIVREIAYEI